MRRCALPVRVLAISALVWLVSAGTAEAQLGSLLSPGPLAKPHAALEGLSNCEKCHERGRKVTPEKCLACHAPVADRIRQKKGIHREATGCVTCHVDHAGVDGELRPFDQAAFDHAGVAAFALSGRHAPLAQKCAACHKTRSFLTASPSCSSCHTDVHKGSLGPKCERCHSTNDAFTTIGRTFDHSVTAFPLTGAHRTTTCVSCHAGKTFKVAKFSTCSSCHVTPHPKSFSTTCTTCHATATWRTKTFDHSRTAFPLVGKHSMVDCASCHKAPAAKVKPASATCAVCHADPHKGAFKQDCKACHSETTFAKGAFDHATTRFPLVDKHGGLACQACHKTIVRTGPAASRSIDFRGAATACASCHADPHRAELGPACERCHSAKTFKVAAFTHPRFPDLFGGRHAPLACAACHKPPPVSAARAAPARAAAPAAAVVPAFKGTATECASCHRDVHLGQVGADCASCHSVAAVKFAADRYGHDRSAFKLTGKHAATACAACHKSETAAFPSGRGTAVRLKGMAATCQSCHQDVHLGQVSTACETCHTTQSFAVKKYDHRKSPRDFFVGRHVTACAACHKTQTRQFPAGRGTAVEFAISSQCVACHTDVHRGTLGTDCRACHKPEPLAPAHLARPVPRS
jgi:hypothetical protein